MWDDLWLNLDAATMVPGGAAYGLIEDAAVGVAAGRIAWIGRRSELPTVPAAAARRTHDGRGMLVTPGLIDCHTHLVYGGDRVREFELRLQGATYEQIARAGGGIRATVAATRMASETELAASASARLERLCAEGVTTVEIKSGYGLDLASERKMLRVARSLADRLPVGVKATFLGAHAVPPEFDGQADAYLDTVCGTMLPALAAEGLVDAVDAFCEGIGFSAAQTERVFAKARALSLPVKLHAEQLSDQQGAQLAARYAALSADHLEHVSAEGVAALAAAGTVAVLLPGAFYFLRETRQPPIDALRRASVPMAVATDCNPGTSPLLSLLAAMNMACTLFRLTAEEALAGTTRHAARALGLADSHGTLEPGRVADLALWQGRSPAELAYGVGFNPCAAVVKAGCLVRGKT